MSLDARTEKDKLLIRHIIDFHQDEESHWVAELTCGHFIHTRHDPPFFPRPWVMTEEGRQEHLDTPLNCVRCDRQELPAEFLPYRQTPTFDCQTLPKGLQERHSTKPGVWGVIHVQKGRLKYKIHAPFNTEVMIGSTNLGIILPEVEHHVEPFADTLFYVEFWHKP